MTTPLWNPLSGLVEQIKAKGGFVNAHSHIDRAYSVRPTDFQNPDGTVNVNKTLHEKWLLVDRFKSESTADSYYQHMAAALRQQKAFGASTVLSFIDCDPIAGMKAIEASVRAKAYAGQELQMRFLTANQTLKGVLSPEARWHFDASLEHVDLIGGLPGADKGREAEHLDVLMEAAKRTGKRLHVHVDQLNTPREKETELLARKTLAWGLEGRVSAVHGISLAAHPLAYRKEVYALCRQAGLSFVACPTAWIDARRTEELQPSHNALTPLDELIPEGIPVALGSDNISDVYKPFSNGDMEVELRVALEAAHFYDVDALVKMATDWGRLALGLP